MEKIDDLDRKIIQIITKNARIPFKDIATECNLSRAAIHQRVTIDRLRCHYRFRLYSQSKNARISNVYLYRYHVGERLIIQRGYRPVGTNSRNNRMSLHFRSVHHAHKTLCKKR